MHSAVMSLSPDFDIVIMAAAVSDYRMDSVSGSKLKKADNGGELHLTLVENPDILKELSSSKKSKQLIVGFAAETATDDELIRIGMDKLVRKGCDLLILNQVGWDQGFGTERNSVTVLASGGDILNTATGSKLSVADTILDCIATSPFQNA
jgi:phosphopantothenoylcysteine decarboxylase/phosphopantothenate--cysteine ligase